MRTLLAVNTLTAVSSQAYASHLNAVFRMAKDCPEDDFILFNGYRTSIDRFRNQAGKLALEGECDFLWFLDDDVLIDPHTYKRLRDHNVDMVSPITYIRSYPFKEMFFKTLHSTSGEVVGLTHYSDWAESETVPQLLKVAALGFSCCLMKVELLKKVPPAWFVTGTGHTEDVYFCVKARQALDNKVGIYVDTAFACGHQLDPEFVHPATHAALMTFYETLNPELKIPSTNGDNAADYLARQIAALDKLEWQVTQLEAHNEKVRRDA